MTDYGVLLSDPTIFNRSGEFIELLKISNLVSSLVNRGRLINNNSCYVTLLFRAFPKVDMILVLYLLFPLLLTQKAC